MTPFNPTDRVSVALEAQQWNQVMAVLADGSYRVVAPIIQSLGAQLTAASEERDDVDTNVVPLSG